MSDETKLILEIVLRFLERNKRNCCVNMLDKQHNLKQRIEGELEEGK